MKCEVYNVKNARYSLLEIEGEHYIVDKDRPFFMFLFPFIHWIFPYTIFKINNADLIDNLKDTREERQKGGGEKRAIGGAIIVLGTSASLTLADWLSFVEHYFGTDSSTKVNAIVLSVILSIILLLWFSFSKFNKRNLSKHIHLEKLETRKAWIRPNTFKHFNIVVFGYFVFGFLAVMTGYIFIKERNSMFLLLSILPICLVLIINSIVVMAGTTKVKFWRDKR